MSNPTIEFLRKVEYERIMIDPAYVLVDDRPEINNGFGNKVKNLNAPEQWAEKGPVRIVARVHPILAMTDLRALFSQTTGQSEVYGIGNDFVLFATHDNDWLKSGLVLRHNNRTYKTFEPYNARMFGEVISKYCMLKDIGSVN